METPTITQLNDHDITETTLPEILSNKKSKVINAIKRFPIQKNESIDVPEEIQYTYEAKDYSRNIKLPELNIEQGYRAIVKITKKPLNNAFFVENDSFDKNLAYRIIELEDELKKVKQENSSLIKELLTLQAMHDSKVEEEGEEMAYHDKLIRKREKFEKFTFIFGLVISLFLILLPLITGLSFSVILPSLIIFLSFPIFIKLRSKLRGNHYEH